MRAPGQYAWRLAPRLGAAIGAWGASAQSARASGPDEPVILGERASAQPLPQRHARRGPRGLREGQAGELQRAAALSNFVKPVRRDAAAAAAQRLADLRALRDDQRAKEAEVAAQEAEHQHWWPTRRDGPSASMRGQAQWMWPCLCCMLHAGCGPDAAWAVAGWGKGRMRRTLLGRWQVGAEAACG
jgi:hypothetical protein